MSRLRIAVLGVALTAACSHQPAANAPTPIASYAAAIENASKKAEAGDYASADRILAEFALSAKGSPEAQEIPFWRALYMIDPLNKNASVAEGLNAIDFYLSNPAAKWYRPQALVVKRTAAAMQALRTQQQMTKVVGRDTVFVTREDEIAALKDQLAKANAELDRIKKRLANPSR